tara:strand:+ start:11497 stop:12150 length:654 start_codon:yes stop_codon:yes gene_type:complete
MRQLILIFLATFTFSITSNAQFNVNGNETILTPKEDVAVPISLKGIQFKKYLSQDYKPAFVDEIKEQTYLRYNIFDDEMEYVKGNQIYYLKKEIGRTVRFADNTTYKVYQKSGSLKYFLVNVEGKNDLVTNQIVKFYPKEEPLSGYDRGKSADFKRKNDEFYIATKNRVIQLPTNKKSFYKFFGPKAPKIKSYLKKNRLSYKKIEDLEKVITYYNTL